MTTDDPEERLRLASAPAATASLYTKARRASQRSQYRVSVSPAEVLAVIRERDALRDRVDQLEYEAQGLRRRRPRPDDPPEPDTRPRVVI